MRRGFLIVMAILTFHLVMLSGCNPNWREGLDCSIAPGEGSCPKLPPAEKPKKPKPKFSSSPYSEALESWRGQNIKDLIKSKNLISSKYRYESDDLTTYKIYKCPHSMCEGFPSSVTKVYNWDARKDYKIRCSTYFGVDDTGKIIEIIPAHDPSQHFGFLPEIYKDIYDLKGEFMCIDMMDTGELILPPSPGWYDE